MITKRRVSLRVRLVALALATLALLGGGWLWVRDSSLVAVRQVQITGVSGPDAGRIRSYHIYFDQVGFLAQLGLM